MIPDWLAGLAILAIGTAVMYWLLYSPRRPLHAVGLGFSAIAGYGLLALSFIGVAYLLFRLLSILL